MNKTSIFDGVSIFTLLAGTGVIAFGFFMMHRAYDDHLHPISAHIAKSEEACQVAWKKIRYYTYQVMPCAEVPGFIATNKDKRLTVVKGKTVELSFFDADGTDRNETSFISNKWLAEDARMDAIPINFYPGTPHPIRRVPTLREALDMGWICVLGVFFAASGPLGAGVRRRRAERRKEAARLKGLND
jgi:hypothetical protein